MSRKVSDFFAVMSLLAAGSFVMQLAIVVSRPEPAASLSKLPSLITLNTICLLSTIGAPLILLVVKSWIASRTVIEVSTHFTLSVMIDSTRRTGVETFAAGSLMRTPARDSNLGEMIFYRQG